MFALEPETRPHAAAHELEHTEHRRLVPVVSPESTRKYPHSSERAARWRAQSRRRCGRGEPSPGADAAAAAHMPASSDCVSSSNGFIVDGMMLSVQRNRRLRSRNVAAVANGPSGKERRRHREARWSRPRRTMPPDTAGGSPVPVQVCEGRVLVRGVRHCGTLCDGRAHCSRRSGGSTCASRGACSPRTAPSPSAHRTAQRASAFSDPASAGQPRAIDRLNGRRRPAGLPRGFSTVRSIGSQRMAERSRESAAPNRGIAATARTLWDY